VTITRADGRVTYVDPVTREERTQNGRLVRVVPLAGFNMVDPHHPGAPRGAKRPKRIGPSYSFEDVDPGALALPRHRRVDHRR
jgi:hypothetical protein